jgi:hypothetical protein
MAGVEGRSDGRGEQALFSRPAAVVVKKDGVLYVADSGNNHTIRQISQTGEVTTLGGTPGHPGSAEGTGPLARFSSPISLALDEARRRLYVADLGNYRICLGVPAIPDAPTIDQARGAVGEARQLSVTNQTGTAWKWELVRRPSASKAQLSSATLPNPTFTPDVPDLFIFRLWATNDSGAAAIRELEYNSAPLRPVSPMRFQEVFSVGVFGLPGKSYALQYKNEITDTRWIRSSAQPEPDPFSGDRIRLFDYSAQPHRFYRVVEE